MDQDKIARINFLARKNKSEGLTEAELRERDALRKEYLNAIRENFKRTLDNIEFVDGSGAHRARKK